MSDRIFHLHMVSDATGETLETMAKAALVQFEGIAVKKHFWPMVRSEDVVGPWKYPGIIGEKKTP